MIIKESHIRLFTPPDTELPLMAGYYLCVTKSNVTHVPYFELLYFSDGNFRQQSKKRYNVIGWLDMDKFILVKEVISALNTFQEDKIMPGCTWGDTQYDNPTVIYGMDTVISGVKEILKLNG